VKRTRLRFGLAAAFVWALGMCGCQGQRIGIQGLDFREALLCMYTEQIIDNLIRAYENQPFVQLEYTELFAQQLDEIGADGTMGETVTDSRGTAFSADSSSTSGRNIVSAFSISGSVNWKGTLNFKARPITNRNRVYQAYIDFVREPARFVRCKQAPAEAVHILRRRNGYYYWVPKGAAEDFLELAMITTFKHGPETVRGYYEVKVVRVGETEQTGRGDTIKATLTFDTFVPNGDALLVVDTGKVVPGRKIGIPLLELEDMEPGAPTRKLTARWSPSKRGIDAESLQDQKARVYSKEHPPEVGADPVVDLLERTVNVLDRIQANQGIN
jgi:hypothetical protein